MKELIKQFAVPMLALLALSSCNKEIDGTDTVAQPSKQITITAIHADDATRTTLIDGGTEVYWQPGDEIKVYKGSNDSKFTTSISQTTKIATFTGEDPEGEGDRICFYPYDACYSSWYKENTYVISIPDIQTAAEGTFASGTWITAGCSSSNEISFRALCGGFRFTVGQEGIKRICLETPWSIATTAEITFENGMPIIEPIKWSSYITLYPPEGGAFKPGKWYYISLIPQDYVDGFSLTFFKDGLWARKEFSSVTVKRGVIGSKQNVDEGAVFNEHESVDLGLSVCWANYNLGSSFKSEDRGQSFYYGATSPSTSFQKMEDMYYPFAPGGFLGVEHDAAAANWGGDWRLPTKDELNELVDNCDWQYVNDMQEVYDAEYDCYRYISREGFVITSKVEGFVGNQIFLPETTQMMEGVTHYVHGYGYWTSTYREDYAYCLYFHEKEAGWEYSGAYYNYLTSYLYGSKFVIRPVIPVSPIAVTGINLDKTEASVAIGQTCQLKANIIPANARNKAVVWTSSDDSIATVSPNGLVTANAGGLATITATAKDGGYTATCKVSVVVPVTGVSLSATELDFNAVGQTASLTATVLPSNASNKTVSWSSSNSSVASVSSGGVVTAKSGGSATITVTTADGGFTATCTVRVTIAVTGVGLNATSISLMPGETYKLTANVSPSNANNKAVSWSSSNTSVATVSNVGLVTAVSDGTASITVTTDDGGYTASCSVKVASKPEPETITFSELGLTNAVQYTTPFDGGNFTITFGGGSNDGKYYNTGAGIRTYAGGTITISSDHTISQIAFTWDGSNCPSDDVADPYGYSTSTKKWTGSAKTVTLTRPSGSGHWRLKSVTVTYSD